MVIIMISIIIIAFVGCISYLFIQNNQLENQIQEINSTKNNTTQQTIVYLVLQQQVIQIINHQLHKIHHIINQQVELMLME